VCPCEALEPCSFRLPSRLQCLIEGLQRIIFDDSICHNYIFLRIHGVCHKQYNPHSYLKPSNALLCMHSTMAAAAAGLKGRIWLGLACSNALRCIADISFALQALSLMLCARCHQDALVSTAMCILWIAPLAFLQGDLQLPRCFCLGFVSLETSEELVEMTDFYACLVLWIRALGLRALVLPLYVAHMPSQLRWLSWRGMTESLMGNGSKQAGAL